MMMMMMMMMVMSILTHSPFRAASIHIFTTFSHAVGQWCMAHSAPTVRIQVKVMSITVWVLEVSGCVTEITAKGINNILKNTRFYAIIFYVII